MQDSRVYAGLESPAESDWSRFVVQLDWRHGALAALVLCVSALLSQALSFSGLAFALFWPPAGIAYALIWRYGHRALVWVSLGVAIPTFLFYPAWGSMLVVMGETGAPWLGVTVLRTLSRRSGVSLTPLRWQLSFYVSGFLAACPTAAALGTLGALAEHRFALATVPGAFLAYTTVESIGLALFAPPLIQWLNRDRPMVGLGLRAGSWRGWILGLPVAIEALRWLLFVTVGPQYADLLIYAYFPLVAGCALTEPAQRTNGLLVVVAVAVLSSQAWRLSEVSTVTTTFELFRLALVILTLSVMGQLLAALAAERRNAVAEIARQAELDPLTGLLNERSFTQLLDQLAPPFAVVLLTLENWPEFEILAGISASYEVQREVTAMFEQNSALTQPARLQGGSFACVLTSVGDWPGPLMPLLERRWGRRGIEMRLIAAGLDVPATAVHDPGELMLGARTLLNEALFHPDEVPKLTSWTTNLAAHRRSYELLVDSIRNEVRAGRLILFGQPIVSADANRRASLEILVRIQGNNGQLLKSAEVAQVLAQNIISAEVDRGVIQATFQWFASRREKLAFVERVAMNLAGSSLSAPSLFDWIERCRIEAGLDAQSFSFEITESQAILNIDAAGAVVQRLRQAGYSVALDDFGTGLATFDYLKRFAVDYLKIDGSFIRNLGQSAIDLEIVTGIVRLARVMNIGTVAEYVADEAIAKAALAAGIDALQGYGIQAPIPIDAAVEWCRTRGHQ
jgi:EAL domain-containing protein (putative c-di-GMP-specific phosphodiesterase class I)